MYFCPTCGNILLLSDSSLACATCPYVYAIHQPLTQTKHFDSKIPDDVLGGKDQWQNVDQADANCPDQKCEHNRAYFMQIQTRSADEPMTTFYKVGKLSEAKYYFIERSEIFIRPAHYNERTEY